MPAWALYRLRRATSYVEAPLDPEPLSRIATEPLERLLDPAFLSDDLLPGMGLTSFDRTLYPPHLQRWVGRGVQPMQLPNQFGPYLAAVAVMDVRSYVEIGVEHGGAFAITVEILRRFGLRRALAVEIGPTPLLFGKWMRPEVEVATLDSQSAEFKRLLEVWGEIDLAFVDGDHAYASVLADFETVRPHAPVIALHDITDALIPGPARAWRHIRSAYASEYDFREFTATYDDAPPRAGIGMAIRRGRSGA